jgi:hypothetical protein
VIFFFKTNERQQSTLPEFESFKIKSIFVRFKKGQRGFFISNGLLLVGLGFKGFHKIFHPELVPNHTVFLSEIRIN